MSYLMDSYFSVVFEDYQATLIRTEQAIDLFTDFDNLNLIKAYSPQLHIRESEWRCDIISIITYPCICTFLTSIQDADPIWLEFERTVREEIANLWSKEVSEIKLSNLILHSVSEISDAKNTQNWAFTLITFSFVFTSTEYPKS